MTGPAVICVASACVCLYVALITARLSRAKGWEEQRLLALAAVSAAPSILCDLAQTMDGVAPHVVIVASRWQLVCMASSVAAWLYFSRAVLKLSRSWVDPTWTLATVALSASAIIPGVVYENRLLPPLVVPWAGAVYHMPQPTPLFGIVLVLLCLGAVIVLFRFARAVIGGQTEFRWHMIGCAVILIIAVNDSLVSSSVYSNVLLLDAGYMIPLFATAMTQTAALVQLSLRRPAHSTERLPEEASDLSSLGKRRFGQYETVRFIARGGMGEVHEARHVALGTRVALKVLHPTLASDPGAARRVLREGRAAAMIRHPHVVTVVDLGTEDGRPYLVMELLEGEDLRQRLQRDAPLTLEQTIGLLLPVISGIATAHAAGVVHRDLKPSNVFLARRHGRIDPVVVDFGISRKSSNQPDSLTASQVIAGTPQYMAPEQLRGIEEASPSIDQYTLGVLLYECVTGSPPFWGDDYYELLHAIMTAPAVAPSVLNPMLPPSFDAVVLRAVSRDPAARFASVKALGAALLPFGNAVARETWSQEFAPAAERGTGLEMIAPSMGVKDRRRRSPLMLTLLTAASSRRRALPATFWRSRWFSRD